MYSHRWVGLACHIVCHVVSAHLFGYVSCCLVEYIACEMIICCSIEGRNIFYCCMLFDVAYCCGHFDHFTYL